MKKVSPLANILFLTLISAITLSPLFLGISDARASDPMSVAFAKYTAQLAKGSSKAVEFVEEEGITVGEAGTELFLKLELILQNAKLMTPILVIGNPFAAHSPQEAKVDQDAFRKNVSDSEVEPSKKNDSKEVATKNAV